MADFDIPGNVLIAGTGVLGAVTGAIGYVFKSKQAELDKLQVRYDLLQEKYEKLLLDNVAAMAARIPALDKMATAQAEQNLILRAVLPKAA